MHALVESMEGHCDFTPNFNLRNYLRLIDIRVAAFIYKNLSGILPDGTDDDKYVYYFTLPWWN